MISSLKGLLPFFLIFIWPSALQAEQKSASVIFTVKVISRTCSFENEFQVVRLDDITTREFTDNSIRAASKFNVGITCGSGVSAVKMVPTGTPDGTDATAFLNTGAARNVALRLLDAEGQILLPDGSRNVTIVPKGGEGNYIFTAGYVATAAGQVTGGGFMSTVTFSFNYE